MVMKVKLLCMLFLMVLTSMLISEINGQDSISVAGIVVDDEGNPVRDALVSMLYPPCKVCIDHIIPGYKTGEEGVFFLDGENIKAKKVRIFIEETVPDGLWNPIFPADLTLERFPEFRGIVVKSPKSGGTIQLGEVSPHVKYRPVSIDLLKLFKVDKDFLTKSSSLRLSVEYKGVRVANDLLIDERDIDKTENKVNFALPKGKWKLLFEISNRNQRKVSKVSVDLESSNQTIYNYENKCN